MTNFETAFTEINKTENDKTEIDNNAMHKVSFETARAFYDALNEVYAYACHDVKSVEGRTQTQIQSKLQLDWEILQTAVFGVTGYTPDEIDF